MLATLIRLFFIGTVFVGPTDQPGFIDPVRNVEVRYKAVANRFEFSSLLPEGWAFMVSVDVDQNGRWGNGPMTGMNSLRRSPDRSFGRDADNGGFCAQSVMASMIGNPDRISASTDCGTVPTRGSIDIGGPDAQGRYLMTLSIPNEELFGARPRSNIQICVWDTRRTTCQHSPARPLVLTRPGDL